MRHRVFGKKLRRDTKERKALFRSLLSALVLKGRIKTTEAKAKAIKGQADKIVTRAKKGTLTAHRQLLAFLEKKAVEKLMTMARENLGERTSGFTQIIKIGTRKGDNTPLALLQWVGVESFSAEKGKKELPAEDRREAKEVTTPTVEKKATGSLVAKEKKKPDREGLIKEKLIRAVQRKGKNDPSD